MTRDDLVAALRAAHEQGDTQGAQRIAVSILDDDAKNGRLAPVGNFHAQTGREYQLANRALQLRRAGREADAVNVIRTMARDRVARNAAGNTLYRNYAAFGLGLNHALGGVGNYVAALVPDNTGRDYNQRLQDLALTSDQIRQEHPVSSTAGEVAGVVATLPVAEAAVGRAAQAARVVPAARVLAPVARASEIGAEARAAELARRGGSVAATARGAARAAAGGAGYGAAYGAADAQQEGRDVGQGAVEGAETGAAGGVALRGAGEVVAPVLSSLARRFMESGAVRQLAARMQEPVADVARRMAEFQQRMGRAPSAAEVLGERNAREVAATISGHGNARDTAIRHSTETQLRRSGDLAEAVSQGRPPAAAATVNADASDAFTNTMRQVGDHRVSLTDEQLAFLTGRDARRLFRGSLQNVGQELQAHVATRDAAATAAQAAKEALTNASQLAQQVSAERARVATITSPTERVRAKNAIPALERQAQRAASVAADARARATQAAAEVKPAEISLRDLENARHSAGQAAGDGAMYFMHDVQSGIRNIAAQSGRPGAQYEQSLQGLAAGKAQAEGITAGRRVVSSGGQAEARAAARAEGAGPEQVQATRTGARQGVYAQLQEDAGQGPRGYRATARDLAQNPGLRTGLEETVGPAEARRLTETGRVADEAAQSLEAATPSHARSMSEEVASQTQSWTNAAVTLSGHTGGAFKARFAQQVLSRLGITPQAADHLAELAFDPKRSGEFMRLMARYSGDAQRLHATLEHLAGYLPAQAQRARAQDNAGIPAAPQRAEATTEAPEVNVTDPATLDYMRSRGENAQDVGRRFNDANEPMTREDAMAALRQADADGDEVRARNIAGLIRAMGTAQ